MLSDFPAVKTAGTSMHLHACRMSSSACYILCLLKHCRAVSAVPASSVVASRVPASIYLCSAHLFLSILMIFRCNICARKKLYVYAAVPASSASCAPLIAPNSK